MHPVSETDDELLALAFPAFAGQINTWRAINRRLDDLCHDFLTVKRSDLQHTHLKEGADAAFLNHLREAMDDLSNEIEDQLRRMRAAKQHANRNPQFGKERL